MNVHSRFEEWNWMYKFPADLKYKQHLNIDVGVDEKEMK